MEIFESLISAKEQGHQLAKQGRVPSIYQREHREFILLASRETPPQGAYPFLKWVGKDLRDADESEWIPILTKLDSLNRAKEACALFYLLGYEPIIVEFSLLGIFDIYLRESDIPLGAWIILESDEDDYLLEIQQPPIFYDEEDEPEFEIVFPND
ncbi:MAG: hypothetical protein ACFFED_00495 [Candidatus Thorarchaeota archaeon]